jgi:hypothetical protein
MRSIGSMELKPVMNYIALAQPPINLKPKGLRVKKRDCVSKTKGPGVRPLSRARERVGERVVRRSFGIAKPRSSPLQGASAFAHADRFAGSRHAARIPGYTLALALFYPQRKRDIVHNRL